MNTTLYLIRHGEVEYQYDEQGRKLAYGPDAHLSDEGKKQIQRLGERFKKDRVKLDVLYTSPFARAQQSALIIAAEMGDINVCVEDTLQDVRAPGWVGRTMKELEEIGGDLYSVPPLTADQESLCGMSIRIIAAIDGILMKERGKHIGIVGHGDPMRVYIDRLIHPNREMPSVARDKYYMGKGEAWWLSFDSKLILKEGALIIPESQSSSSVERKIY